MPSVTLELAQRANALALEVSEQCTPQTPAPNSVDKRITAALTEVEHRNTRPISIRSRWPSPSSKPFCARPPPDQFVASGTELVP
jgi:hypothetical protein